MSRKFDDFERLLPIRKRNVLTPVENQEFYRAKKNPGTYDYDYEYDYDLVDRAPGYDVYNFKDGDREGKRDSQCLEVAESQFETVYKNSCNIIFEKSCKIEYVQSDPGRIDYFCEDDKVVSRNTFLSSGKTERSHKRIVKI